MTIKEKAFLVCLLFFLNSPEPTSEWAFTLKQVIVVSFAVLFVLPSPDALRHKSKGEE